MGWTMGVHAPDATIEKNLPDASADRRGNIAGTTAGLLKKYPADTVQTC